MIGSEWKTSPHKQRWQADDSWREIADAPPQSAAAEAETVRIVPGTARTIPGSQPAASSAADKLAKLADLRDRGVLSEAEFEAQTAKLLSES